MDACRKHGGCVKEDDGDDELKKKEEQGKFGRAVEYCLIASSKIV